MEQKRDKCAVSSDVDGILGETSELVESYDQFGTWVRNQFREIIPHDMCECGIGEVGARGLRIHKWAVVDCVVSYLQEIRQPSGFIRGGVIDLWLQQRVPVAYDAQIAASAADLAWVELFRRFELGNMVFHGVQHCRLSLFTYLSFYRMPSPATQWLDRVANMAPYLHAVLTRLLRINRVGATTLADTVAVIPLTEREREIVQWLQRGKTNWEIGQILRISDKTVKNHLHNIFAKAGVRNRVQLTNKAIELSWITVPAEDASW